MTPERWAQIDELFHRAAECSSEQRAILLDEACRNDSELRREIDALLLSDRSAGGHVKTAVRQGLDGFLFPLAGEVISHYRILDGLGGGGMGLVYRAEDLKLGRRVALKFLPEESANNSAALRRFEREARSASALEHPNICPIYEFGEHDGQPFIVMQLLEGQTLRELISAADPGKPPLSPGKLFDLAIQIADALEAAHQRGIIHRDIKPANIFLTKQGQVKILDFGIAKLVHSGTEEGDEFESDTRDSGNPRETTRETMPPATGDLFLSRTGVAMGTAGYMSPEQARGEKLDARTDLFSFGLVLYEMATGQRAFKGETGRGLHQAILTQVPVPAGEINPQLPAKFEKIIARSLEKDLGARYQSAADMRTDLLDLKHDLEQKPFARTWKLTAGSVALLLSAAAFWFARREPSITQIPPDVRFQQLTINSPEVPVRGGAISPDGKYLAYSDAKGIHIKLVGTDETQRVPQPDALKNERVTWEVVPTAWFPDSKRLVANAHPASETPSAWSSHTSNIWVVSVGGAKARKLRDNALAWSVSPDGSSISFGTNNGKFGEREIWLMGSDGEQPRKLYEVDEKTGICCLYFFPDRQRISYTFSDESGDSLVARDLNGGPVVRLLPPSETRKMGDFSWLPDGQIVYSEPCDIQLISFDAPCNIWIKRLDPSTGKLIAKPRRLTNWAGVWMNGPSVTADGRRVAFLESSGRSSNYMADLENAGRRLVNPRPFNLEGEDSMLDWTADSKAVILALNRGDHYALHRQSLNSDTQEAIVTSAAGLIEAASVSPDGKWIIVQVRSIPGGNSVPVALMRVPISGGLPELIFSMREWSSHSCARPPSDLCAVAEQSDDHKQMIITSFDPVKGRGSELARFDLSPNYESDPNRSVLQCIVSPEGERIAVATGAEGPIQIRTLLSGQTQIIRAKRLGKIDILGWAADGNGPIVLNIAHGGGEILHVDLKGNAKLLWKCNQDRCFGAPSPDGRHFAISDSKGSANMWMMENF